MNLRESIPCNPLVHIVATIAGVACYFTIPPASAATSVQLDDTDDDATVKAIFAFNEVGDLIGQTSFGSGFTGANPFFIDTSMTGGELIHSIEFDTQPGTAGGSWDGTVFTIDNFSVTGTPKSVPEPISLFGTSLVFGCGLLWSRKRMKTYS